VWSKRARAVGRVVVAGRVLPSALKPLAVFAKARSVAKERIISGSRVVAAGGDGVERIKTIGLTSARRSRRKIVRAQPTYGPPRCVLGLIEAALGWKEEALAKASARSSFCRLRRRHQRRGDDQVSARIAAGGDNDLACEQLATALRYPTSPSYGDLKLLRVGPDPRRPMLEKIVASLAPR